MTFMYQNQIFQILADRTRNFQFDSLPNEPESASEDELREFRLKDIIVKVINMGIRKYYQTPEIFRTVHAKEDWIQDAIIILMQQVEEYDPNRGDRFNRFILFRVKMRLISLQRKIYRENPPVNDDLRKIVVTLRQEHGREPTAKEFSDFTDCSEQTAQEILDTGVGPRVFVNKQGSNIKKNNPPENQEKRKILWVCISQLEPRELRLLFLRHEIEGISLQKLYNDLEMDKIGNISLSSLSTFKRHYRENARFRVAMCVRRYLR